MTLANIQEAPKITNQRDVVDMLYRNSFGGLFISILAVILLNFTFTDPATATFKYLWASIMLSLMIGRLADAFYWRYKLYGRPYAPAFHHKRFFVFSLLTAVCWSVYAVAIFDLADMQELAATLVILCAVGSGGATVLSPDKNLLRAFVLVLMLPISITGAFSDQAFYQLLGGLGIGYAISMEFLGRKLANFTRDAITLKTVHQDLLAHLQQEQQELSGVNKQLEEAYAELHASKANLETQVKNRTQEIYQLSNKDPLTQLYNRNAFIQQLQQIIEEPDRSGASMALFFVDLGGFKQINDSLGHKLGDDLLIKVAKRIEGFSLSSLVCRWGGDEFLLVFPHTNAASSVNIAKALQANLQKQFQLQENQLNISATVGIAMFPEHTRDADQLIQYADFTMYHQKNANNKQPGLFNPDLLKKFQQEKRLRDGIKQAIDKQELAVHYQPIMHADGKNVWAFEALLRWQFEGSFVRPDIFIPLAEHTGQICKIGTWVLNRACLDASHFFDEHISVSVNVSVLQLQEGDFATQVEKALDSSQLSASRLHLEITESAFAGNLDSISEQLQRMQEMGVKVSIDDFGTGYSSLSQLLGLSVDHVKIDKTFVDSLAQGGDTIINATMSISQSFNYQSVAEGIETQEQAEKLRKLGVNYLQGYLYAKPMPLQEAENWQRQFRS